MPPTSLAPDPAVMRAAHDALIAAAKARSAEGSALLAIYYLSLAREIRRVTMGAA